jgi:hypothetical protein
MLVHDIKYVSENVSNIYEQFVYITDLFNPLHDCVNDNNYFERGYLNDLKKIVNDLSKGILIIYKDKFNFYIFDMFYILLDFAILLNNIRKDNYYKFFEFGHSISNALIEEINLHMKWRGLFPIFRFIYFNQEFFEKNYKSKTIELFEIYERKIIY